MSASTPTPAETATALRTVVESALPRLMEMPDDASARRAAPGAWSAREIIGHLIDSAQNNQGRFVRAQLGDALIFPGYAQEEWVRLQGYAEREWGELLVLWAGCNRHLAELMERTPQEVAARARREHNLHEIAWCPVPAGTPTTLGYFMADYVGHLEHHLRQIRAVA